MKSGVLHGLIQLEDLSVLNHVLVEWMTLVCLSDDGLDNDSISCHLLGTATRFCYENGTWAAPDVLSCQSLEILRVSQTVSSNDVAF